MGQHIHLRSDNRTESVSFLNVVQSHVFEVRHSTLTACRSSQWLLKLTQPKEKLQFPGRRGESGKHNHVHTCIHIIWHSRLANVVQQSCRQIPGRRLQTSSCNEVGPASKSEAEKPIRNHVAFVWEMPNCQSFCSQKIRSCVQKGKIRAFPRIPVGGECGGLRPDPGRQQKPDEHGETGSSFSFSAVESLAETLLDTLQGTFDIGDAHWDCSGQHWRDPDSPQSLGVHATSE